MGNPKWLVRAFFREHWRLYALTTLSILASEAVAVQFPRLLGRFTDALQAGLLDTQAVARYALWLAVVGAGSVALFGLGQQGNGQLGRSLEYQLRRELFAHWERLAVTAFYRRPIGDLLNHALNDVRAVREAFAGGMNNLTNAVFLLVAALWMMVQTVPLPLLAVSMLPLLLIPACVVHWGPRIRAATRQAQEALSSMSDLAEESFSAIRLVKATASEPVELQRFTERVDDIVRRQLGIFRQSGLFQAAIPFLGALSFAVALAYGGAETAAGRIPLGAFVAFTLYLALLITPLQQLGQVFNTFQRASASLQRLQSLLLEPPEIQDEPRAQPLVQVRGEVVFRIASYTYPGAREPALRDVYLTVRPGQTVGLVGRTGAGKTTLVNLLPRVYDPPPGTVFVDGHDVRSLTLDSLRRAIAYVPQDGFLFSDTLAENLRFGKPDADLSELQAVLHAAAFTEALVTFPAGLETVVGERGVMLSGGQRQRVAIARALLKDAPILVLDDSLSAVDTATEARILDALYRLRRGRTTLLVAHRLSVVQHADWIVVLDQGTVAEQGTHGQLLRQGGLYADMYRLQALQAEGRA